MYPSGGSDELWAWTFKHTSWTLQYVFEGILFSRLLQGLICDPIFENVGKRFMAKTYCPVSLLSVINSKIFEKLVNNRLVDHLTKCGLFSDFQYSFRSTADILAVVSDRFARAFNRSRVAWALALDIYTQANLNLMKFHVRHLPLFVVFFFFLTAQSQPKGHQEPCNEVRSLSLPKHLVGFEQRTFQFYLQPINPLGHSYFVFSCWYTTLVVLDGKTLQEYPVKAGVLHGCSFPLFLLYIHDLPDVIYNIAISVDNATHYSKYVRHLICGNN